MRQIMLPASMDQQASRALATELKDVSDQGGTIILDGGDVREIGLSGLQLLLSALRTRANDGADIRIVNASPFLTDSAQLVGALDDA
jgi:anti-anti-sigma regulatory factor